MVQKAKELCEDLLANVKEQYLQFKNRPPRNFGGPGGYGERQGSSSGSYQGYGGGGGGGGYNSRAPAAASPSSPPPSATANTQPPADYAAQYSQYYSQSGDPYAAYGGYAA